MHLSKIEKDKMFYEDHGVITLQSGKEVNNLMIYGVPYSENEEEDPVITEEKVSSITF